MSDTRGLTLRKKGGRQRPQISEPKRISALGHAQKPSSENANNLAVPRDRNQQGGATSDLVKRRYSTRFNQLPDFSSGAPPIPGIPALPAQYGGSTQPVSGRISPSGGSRLLRVDANALRDPKLQAEKCLQSVSHLELDPADSFPKTLQICFRMHPNRTFETTKTVSARSRIEYRPICSRTFIRIGHNSSRSARRLKNLKGRCVCYAASCRNLQALWGSRARPLPRESHPQRSTKDNHGGRRTAALWPISKICGTYNSNKCGRESKNPRLTCPPFPDVILC